MKRAAGGCAGGRALAGADEIPLNGIVAALASAPGAELHQTHGSWVVVTEDRAIKIKKPARFSFLNYSTVSARRRACQEEVRVNRELAPDIYLGVQPVYDSPPYVGARAVGSGGPVDYAVEMARFDDRSTVQALLLSGRLREAHVDAVASRVAEFHQSAGPVGAWYPQPATWRAQAMADLGDIAMLGADATRRRRFCSGAAARHHDLMHQRWADGLVRDGHGDLRAEHVLLRSPVTIVDRLEFDRALRIADVADDLAFLAMDLERLGARWAADLLVEAYAAAGGRPAPPALAALYAWRRAIVRAKVALISRDGELATIFEQLADRLAWRARRPATLIVFGPPASGKSTISRELGRLLELPVISSDVVRKRLHGLAPEQRGGAEVYTPAATEATYAALSRIAAETERSSGGVIVDATFGTAAHRTLIAAGLPGARWLHCTAPVDVLAERAAMRERAPHHVSDAGPAVTRTLAAAFESPDELSGAFVLDTQRTIADLHDLVAAWLDRP